MSDRAYPVVLGRDGLDWIDFEFAGARRQDAERQARTAARLLRGLYRDGVPGMILGDEVGMGKTFEAFGVIAALLRHQPNARVAVLTHSGTMAKEWCDRWSLLTGRKDEHPGALRGGVEVPPASLLNGAHELGATGLVIGSYETLKRVSSENARAVLERVMSGRYLRRKSRARLRRGLFDTWARHAGDLDGIREPSQAQLDAVWAHYDDTTRTWKSASAAGRELRRVVFRCARTKRPLDLLVVDEAHKLAARQRKVFFEEVLHGRSRRALYVTATPFALDVRELLDRIEDMFEATGLSTAALEPLRRLLDRYRERVETRQPPTTELRRLLQRELGKYLVRSTWDACLPGTKIRRRRVEPLIAPASPKSESHALAGLALERAFHELDRRAGRTHRATHRQTLCSSHAAIRAAVDGAGRRGTGPSFLRSLPALLPREESPKFQAAASFLVEKARRREKVVVFCKRLATIRALHGAIEAGTADLVAEERRRWRLLQPRAALLSPEERARFRLAAYRGEKIPVGGERKALARLNVLLQDDDVSGRRELWKAVWGPGRKVEWVGRFTGGLGTREGDRRTAEDVIFSFNLPGPPYVLLCNEAAREGIDLHRWCRRILHYDLEWNPAYLEKEVGRIDRMGSLSWRERKPVEIFYVWQAGTYEERIAAAVEQRLAMMRTLLGAGEWLAADPASQEWFSSLDKYQLDFSP
jgi:hypothetical protein